MPYLVPANLLERFGPEEMAQISDHEIPRIVTAELLQAAVNGGDMSGWSETDTTAIAAAVQCLATAIDDAQSEIDSYLSSRYQVPLASPPAILKRLTGDIARYFLYEDHPTETIEKRYEQAIAFLRAVAAGKATLDVDTPSSPSGGGSVEIVTAGKVFGRRERGL